jgi:hypothetical protein
MSEITKPINLTEDQQFAESKPIIEKKPDERSGLNIEARFKIYDPESGNVIVEGRA